MKDFTEEEKVDKFGAESLSFHLGGRGGFNPRQSRGIKLIERFPTTLFELLHFMIKGFLHDGNCSLGFD